MEKSSFCCFFIAIFIFCHGSFSSSACIPGGREALFEFKNKLEDPSNRLQSWDIEDHDCYKWYGVICSNLANHVLELHLQPLPIQEHLKFAEKSRFGGEISSSLLNLKHLRYLDLSNNDFGGIPIPKFLGSLESLRFLNLSNSGFGGIIPPQLGNLSNLIYLNLNGFNLNLGIHNLDWLSGLSSLQFLDLSSADLRKSIHWLETVNKLSSIVELHLSGCYLDQHIPQLKNLNFSSLSVLDLSHNSFGESLIPNWILGLKNLVSLDLSYNQFHGPISDGLQNLSSIQQLHLSHNQFNSSIPNWLYDFKKLEILNLGYNSLEGKISNSIRNMTSLTSLDLSVNQFEGGIPRTSKHLCNLGSLNFLGTKLGQEMDDVLEILSGCSMRKLESFDLSGCGLFGKLSDRVAKFKNLRHLSLTANSISGPIPWMLGELKSLKTLFLDHNKFVGTIPLALGGLSELEGIDISYNLLEGVVSEMHFANLTNLRTLGGSMNQLILRVSSDWIPPFLHLQVLELSRWEIGPEFPVWPSTLRYLKNLDLSNSRISSAIPNWFWNSSFEFSYLNLSYNQIHGVIPDFGLTSLVIDLSSNCFEGLVPQISSNTISLDLSNNSFSGSISDFICDKMHQEKQMLVLDLDNNLLTGEIPDCWTNWTVLSFLRLSNNNFSGTIPESIGNLTSLGFLHFQNNSLSGEIPLSLQNSAYLITLNLGENKLTCQIPNGIWEKFPFLSILILRANKFHGKIPDNICHLTSLQILDLSYNSLFESISYCIDNFTFMATTASSIRDFSSQSREENGVVATSTDEAMIMMKGRIAKYDTILEYVKIIDLSSNNLSGEIPEEITRLFSLQSLNLSNNFLLGNIPEYIGVMKGLEVLDFSRNRISGSIPQNMTNLTFLSMLNLSYNNLNGQIPTGTQMQSFPSSSFIGNEGLWGPLPVDNFSRNGSVPAGDENGKGGEVNWELYASIVVGFVVGFWSIVLPLAVNRRWRHVHYHFLDGLWNKIWWNFRSILLT